MDFEYVVSDCVSAMVVSGYKRTLTYNSNNLSNICVHHTLCGVAVYLQLGTSDLGEVTGYSGAMEGTISRG